MVSVNGSQGTVMTQTTHTSADGRPSLSELHEQWSNAWEVYRAAFAVWDRAVGDPAYVEAGEALDRANEATTAAFQHWQTLNQAVRECGDAVDAAYAAALAADETYRNALEDAGD